MNIKSLEYFRKIAEVKSISKVSQHSHISQSALSQIIQKIEESMGYDLFIRSNKGVELTKMGKIVYDYSDLIIKTYDKMKAELECMSSDQCNMIINSTWAISYYSIPRILVKIKDQYPYIHYELRSDRSEDIIQNVENGLAEFGIIYGDVNSRLLTVYPFGEEKIVLVATKDFNVPDKISINELFTYNLINFKHGCYYTDINHAVTKLNHNFNDLTPLLALDSISAVKSSVVEGFGLSFLPYSSVKKEINEGAFKLIEVEKLNLTLNVNIISKNKEKLIRPVLNVIDIFLKIGVH